MPLTPLRSRKRKIAKKVATHCNASYNAAHENPCLRRRLSAFGKVPRVPNRVFCSEWETRLLRSEGQRATTKRMEKDVALQNGSSSHFADCSEATIGAATKYLRLLRNSFSNAGLQTREAPEAYRPIRPFCSVVLLLQQPEEKHCCCLFHLQCVKILADVQRPL